MKTMKACVKTATRNQNKPKLILHNRPNLIAQKVNLVQLENRCRSSIDSLFQEVVVRGGKVYGKPGDQYAYLDNDSKILAVAHCDTVQDCNHFAVSHITNETLIHNAKLDDRLGVYTILDLLPKLGIVVDILLTENEEIGQTTASQFKTDKKYNWIVEFDRAGVDAVTYQYEFEKQVRKFFKVGNGLFSDISDLGHLGCKAFNVGVGYYEPHSARAFMVLEEYSEQVARFLEFYDRNKAKAFSHKEEEFFGHWHPEIWYFCEKCCDYYEENETEFVNENDVAICPVCHNVLAVEP